MDEELKKVIIALLVVIVLLVGSNFVLIPTQEECLSMPYLSYNESLQASLPQKFIPMRFIWSMGICNKYAYEREVEVCTNGSCYMDKKIIYSDKESYDKYT